MAFFWAGLVVLLSETPAPLCIGGIGAVALLTLSVQLTWEDKSYYLDSRAPVSVACLREWRTAPPECHDRVFQWGKSGFDLNELALLAEPLERRGLSVFSARRTYLLQGDLAVGRVELENRRAATFLSRDGTTPADPNDFHRLDLVLGPDAAVTWRVDLPPSLKSARFETRVRASADDPMLARGARVAVAGEPLEARALVPAGVDEPLALDLRAFARSGGARTFAQLAQQLSGPRPIVARAQVQVVSAGHSLRDVEACGTTHTCPHCHQPAHTYLSPAPLHRKKADDWAPWLCCTNPTCVWNGARDYAASLNIARLGMAFLITYHDTKRYQAYRMSESKDSLKPVSYTGTGATLLLPSQGLTTRPFQGKCVYYAGWMASIALRTSQPKNILALLSTSHIRKRMLLRA